MPLAGIVTLLCVALTVAALAFFLIHVIILLRTTSFALGTIVAGLRAIAYQTRPLAQLVGEINRDLGDVQSVLEGALGSRLTGDDLPAETELWFDDDARQLPTPV